MAISEVAPLSFTSRFTCSCQSFHNSSTVFSSEPRTHKVYRRSPDFLKDIHPGERRMVLGTTSLNLY